MESRESGTSVLLKNARKQVISGVNAALIRRWRYRMITISVGCTCYGFPSLTWLEDMHICYFFGLTLQAVGCSSSISTLRWPSLKSLLSVLYLLLETSSSSSFHPPSSTMLFLFFPSECCSSSFFTHDGITSTAIWCLTWEWCLTRNNAPRKVASSWPTVKRRPLTYFGTTFLDLYVCHLRHGVEDCSKLPIWQHHRMKGDTEYNGQVCIVQRTANGN